MKKINLFNRNIDLPSYRRRGLPFPWERGPAVQPGGMGITPSPLSPTKFLKFCGTRFGATPSWKEGEHKVPSYRRMPVSRGFNRGGGIPLFSGMTAVIFALFVATPSFATPTELDKKTVASKAYVDTKQNMIPAAEEDYQSVLTDTDNDGVVGKMQIITADYLDSAGIYFADLGYASSTIPTSGAIAFQLDQYQIKLPAAWTDPTNDYNMASTGGQTIDLETTEGDVGRRYITAGGAQPLTQKTGADNVILYINGTKTLAQYQTSNFGGTGNTATTNQNYIKGALVSLELLKDVYSELNSKITNNALPTGTTGTVVTYNGTNAQTGVQEFGERAVYDPANAYDAQNDATKLATMASVKYECAGYEAGHENDPDYCWLWALPN